MRKLHPMRAAVLPRTIALASLLALAACGGGDGSVDVAAPGPVPEIPSPEPEPEPVPETPTTPLADCSALAGITLPAGRIGLPSGGATISSAVSIAGDASGNNLGAYCQVRGAIRPVDPSAPDINFAVNLPQPWNGKAIHFGGGGFNGRLIDGTEPIRFGPADKPAPLALGYATFGDDSGHQSSSITDARFAAGDEALANYGGLALKKTHDVAMALIGMHYGSASKQNYFLGTSTGGRDALAHIQRWPDDYIGVIANEPALNYSGTRLSNVAVGRALYNDGGAGWINVAKTLLVQKTVLQACDKLDGAADGIVSNVESCRQLNSQILASLRCPGGTDTGNTCLSDRQIATVRTIESPLDLGYALANGVTRAGGYNLLEGALVAGPYTTRDLGSRSVPANPATSADANMYVTGDQWVKYFVTRIAGFDTLTFDPASPGAYTQRVADVSAITDATNPDLRPFLARGGRLIMLHGLADEVISPNSTIDYYHRVVATVGQAAVDAGIRFYTVPGMGHGTGVFIPNWDSLAALENWVERGLAPATGIASDAVAGTYGRTRPLCQYPAWPKYKGSGSMDAAVNFSCVQEAGDPLACPNLPASVTAYKGGNTHGEEVTLRIDPAQLSYTATIDASVQRTAGTERSGTLLPLGSCSYASGENGAVFTFGAGGVVQGGIAAPGGGTFLPLLAFQSTFDNVSNPAVFNTIADIYNAVGIQYGSGGTATTYAASARIRNAGTFQTCQDETTGRFVTYDAGCKQTTKGYLTYNTARGAFDLRSTPAAGNAVTTGGTLAGSVVAGKVGSSYVPLVLWRESASSYGMRLYAPQQTQVAGAADGSYATVGSAGGTGTATVANADLATGSGSSSLAFDVPVLGVARSTGAQAGSLLFTGGLYGFIADTGSALELGVRQ